MQDGSLGLSPLRMVQEPDNFESAAPGSKISQQLAYL